MEINSIHKRTQAILKVEGEENDAFEQPALEEIEESLKLIDDLKYFLATAPINWQENQIIRRYHLNNERGFVSCVFWNNLYYITGTDIVKCCVYIMEKFGRKVIQRKKFEEGIFSDLRNLKCGVDATLEQPKSPFLQFLFKNSCLKTQKKQKVFFWFSVPHDKLFADALERDLKREAMGQVGTTKAISDPALSYKYDAKSHKSLYEQLYSHIESQKTRIKELIAKRNKQIGDDIENVIEREFDFNLNVGNEEQLPLSGGGAVANIEDTVNKDGSNFDEQNLDPVLVENVQPSKHNDSSEQVIEIDSPPKDINKGAESDNGDFPLDYFNFDIEYPETDEVADSIIPVTEYPTTVYSQDPYQPYQGNFNRVGDGVKYGLDQTNFHRYSSGGLGSLSARRVNVGTNFDSGYPVERRVSIITPVNLEYGSRSSEIYQGQVPKPISAYRQHRGDILSQTIDQPLLGFEGIFSPFNNDLFGPLDNWNWGIPNQQQQPQQVFPQMSSQVVYGRSPNYNNISTFPWIQSPFVKVNAQSSLPMYYGSTTPQIIRRKVYHAPSASSSTTISFSSKNSKPERVTKPPHSAGKALSAKAKLDQERRESQRKIKQSAKQLQKQIISTFKR